MVAKWLLTCLRGQVLYVLVHIFVYDTYQHIYRNMLSVYTTKRSDQKNKQIKAERRQFRTTPIVYAAYSNLPLCMTKLT